MSKRMGEASEGILEYGNLAKCISAGRKNEVVIDFARLCAAHYAKLVHHVSRGEERIHNNKTLFLESFDITCRSLFAPGAQNGRQGPSTEDPKDLIRYLMAPWHDAMELEDPSRFQLGDYGPMPIYVGREEDATCVMLSLCASVDITPIALRWGIEDGRPARVWGLIADGNLLWNSDINDVRLALGQYQEFPEYDEAEVPL